MKEILKHEKLAQSLLEDISSGVYPPGTAIPSQPCLMDLFGVSKITVRKAVDFLENEGYIRKGLGRGNGSVVLKRSENLKKTRLAYNFGIFGDARILDITYHDMPAVAKGIISGLERWNASLSVYPFLSERHPSVVSYAKSVVSKNMVDGLYICSCDGDLELCRFLQEIRFPFVFILTAESDRVPDDLLFPMVRIHERKPLKNMILEQMKKGFRKVILLGAEEDFFPERTDSLLQSFIGMISGVTYEKYDLSHADFMEVMGMLKKHLSPGTLFLSSNSLMEKIDNAVCCLGLKIPEDVDFIFYKHYASGIPFSGNSYKLMDRPYEKAGIAAAKMMHDLIQRKETGMELCFGQHVILNSYLTTLGEKRK